MSRLSRSDRNAFSLVELLAVISIISLLTVVVGPALSSIGGANGTTRAVTEVAGSLEHARQSAMRLSTWVWVGVRDTSDLNSGSAQVSIVELASRDGSSDSSTANLMPLRKNVHVEGVTLPADSDPDSVVLGTQAGGPSLKWPLNTANGRNEVDFSGRVIAFSPEGEAIVESDSTPRWIRIPFATFGKRSDKISVLISGPSGQVIVAR